MFENVEEIFKLDKDMLLPVWILRNQRPSMGATRE